MVQTKRRGIRTRLPPDYKPGEFTVLCGRGNEYTTSAGNQHLKSLIDKHLTGYSQARGKLSRSAIVSEIMRNVRAVCPDPTFVKFEDGGWWEVDKAFARDKIGSMFRDALHTQYRSSTKAKFARKKAQASSTMRQEESVRTIVNMGRSSSLSSSVSSQSFNSTMVQTKRRGIRTRLPPDYIPGEFTVLCGRGKEYTTSIGNQHLKSLIDKHLKGYSQARGKVPKSAIVSDIMRSVRAVCPEPTFVKFEDGSWWEVDKAFAREKIGCMFRDALHPQYRSSTKAKSARKKAQSPSTTLRQAENVPISVNIGRSSSVASSASSQSSDSTLPEESYASSLVTSHSYVSSLAEDIFGPKSSTTLRQAESVPISVNIGRSSSVASSASSESSDSSLPEENYASSLEEDIFGPTSHRYVSSLAEDIFGPKSMNLIRPEPAPKGDVIHDYGSTFSRYLPSASPRSSDLFKNSSCLSTDEDLLDDFADDLYPIFYYFLLG
eukprot:scaffold3515_cov126-Cylindrotheca_fusiformis.AAC.42